MPLRSIITYPASVLRKSARLIEDLDDDILRLSEDMLETMRLARGAGLAANQVGVPLRLIVLEADTEKKTEKPIIVVNPVIVERDANEEIAEEGCLSLPKFYEFVKRAEKVLVRGMSLNGEAFEMECEGHMARAFQHEIDHLNGILFIDHLSPVKKDLFKKRYSKQGR
jgi:peptide deformylase